MDEARATCTVVVACGFPVQMLSIHCFLLDLCISTNGGEIERDDLRSTQFILLLLLTPLPSFLLSCLYDVELFCCCPHRLAPARAPRDLAPEAQNAFLLVGGVAALPIDR